MNVPVIGEHGTGYIPTPIDRLIKSARYAQLPHLQAAADLTRTVYLNSRTRVENQGQLGSCVGHAVSSAVECLELQSSVPIELSRRWVWQTAKNRMGVSGNVGVYIDVGCDIGIAGVPTEDDVPYQDQFEDVSLPTAPALIDTAISHSLILGDVVAGTWAAINAGQPVVIGVSMGSDGFYQAFVQGNLVTNKGTKNDFFHCMWAWGVTPDFVLVRNSWGDQVGPDVKLASPLMGTGDIAFTHAAFRACCDEARAFTGIVVPEPEPLVPVKRLFVNIWTKVPAPDYWHVETVPLGPVPDKGAWYQYVEKKEGAADKVHNFDRMEP